MTIERWDASQANRLAALVEAALPAEGLSTDELLACCWDDPGVVMATADGTGAVAAVVRRFGEVTLGWIRLLVVHPGARRQGHGRALVAAAEDWCGRQGARHVRFGGSAPFYLWPGIDTTWTAGLCLAEQSGYRVEGAELNLSCPTTFRAATPDGVELRRLVDDHDVAAVVGWCRIEWPYWVAELERAVEQGGAFGAFGPDVLGFACHSVLRAAWVGPMAARPADGTRTPGVGSALLSELCRDLMVAGYPDAQIAWVSNVSFYAKAAGAQVSRVFRTVVRDLPR